jgi:hypothetical protein
MLRNKFVFLKSMVPAVFIIIGSWGCNESGKSSDSTLIQGSLTGHDFSILEAGAIENSGTSIMGTGEIIFNTPLGEIESNKHFQLSFSLQEGGVLSLISHSNQKLGNGIEIQIIRNDRTVYTRLVVGGESTTPKILSGVDGTKSFNLCFDVHNQENPAHILIWNGEDFSESTALLNSEVDERTPGRGDGIFWGLRLNKVTLTRVDVTETKLND